jgi:protein required for attachment to host cells
MRIRAEDWVVLCDGRKAIIAVNVGDPDLVNLKVLEEHDAPNPPTHEQGSDRPGRVHESHGNSRSAMEQTDWHANAERAFLAGIAERLDKAVSAREVSRFLIVAPPRALGMIRGLLKPETRRHVFAELRRDYVKMPVHQIETHLRDS